MPLSMFRHMELSPLPTQKPTIATVTGLSSLLLISEREHYLTMTLPVPHHDVC